MNRLFYAVLAYALLIASGGVIGFIQAKSLPSLIMGSLFAIALFSTLPAIKRGDKRGIQAALGLSLFIGLFFTYRFFLSYAFFPAGFVSLTSFALFAFLTRSLASKSSLEL